MNKVRDWLGALSRRERVLLACGASVLALLLFYVIAQGARSRVAKRKAAIAELTKGMDEIKKMAADFRELDATLAAINSQYSGSSLEKVMATVERIASEEGLGDRIEGMKPKTGAGTDPSYEEISVDVHLTKMDTESLVRFLFKVESAPGYIKVKRLRITGKGDPGSRTLDAQVQVSSFTKRA